MTSKTALCPCCRQSSRYIHSYYQRTLADLPVNTLTVQLKIQARRFECHNEQCERKIFCERLSHFAGAHDQRSTRLTTMIRAIGLALNAESGKCLAKQLGIQVSRDSVLRIIRRTPLEVIEAPKVIGIDDWAIRKRQRYGTLIIDHERRRPMMMAGCSCLITTYAVERVNLGLRSGVSALCRRSASNVCSERALSRHIEIRRAIYNFIQPHRSLRVELPVPVLCPANHLYQRYLKRIPDMAADLTTPILAMEDLLLRPALPQRSPFPLSPPRLSSSVR